MKKNEYLVICHSVVWKCLKIKVKGKERKVCESSESYILVSLQNIEQSLRIELWSPHLTKLWDLLLVI